jgi:hypothetical protein
LKNQVLEVEKRLLKKYIKIISENLKNELFGTTETKCMLITIFEDHNNKIKELVGKEYAPSTLERYKTSLSYTKEFLNGNIKFRISR